MSTTKILDLYKYLSDPYNLWIYYGPRKDVVVPSETSAILKWKPIHLSYLTDSNQLARFRRAMDILDEELKKAKQRPQSVCDRVDEFGRSACTISFGRKVTKKSRKVTKKSKKRSRSVRKLRKLRK